MNFFASQDKARARGRLFFIIYVPTLMAAVVGIYFAVSLAIMSVSSISYQMAESDSSRYHWQQPQPDNFLKPYHPDPQELYLSPGLPPLYLPAPLYGAEPRIWATQPLIIVGGTLFLIILTATIYRCEALRQGGGAYIAKKLGGQQIIRPQTSEQRKLINIVEEMALASGLPVPRVFILPREQTINAFTAGLSQSDAIIGVTQGALDQLTRDELQGVIGHEFAHILNQDCNTNMLMSGWLYGLLVFSIAGKGLCSFALMIMRTRTHSSKSANGKLGLILLILPPGVLLYMAGSLGHLMASIIEAAFSRTREQLADAFAVQFTRNDHGLAGALKKIGGTPRKAALGQPQALALKSFFIAAPAPRRNGRWLSPHPSLESRIAALEPGWDGEFIPIYLKPSKPDDEDENEKNSEEIIQQAEHELRVNQSPLARGIVNQPGGWNKAILVALAAVGGQDTEKPPTAFGRLAAESLASTRDLIDQLPTPVLQSLRSSRQIKRVVAAVLLSQDKKTEARQMELIKNIFGQNEANAALEIQKIITPGLKLTLLQMASPSLKGLSLPEQTMLTELMNQMIRIDGRIDLFELAAERLVTKALTPPAVASSAPTESEMKAAASLVLSALAYLGLANRPTQPDPEKSFQAGAKLMSGWGEMRLESQGTISAGRLKQALAQLGSSPAQYRICLIQAALTMAIFDEAITPGEQEMLKTLAAALDIPIPWHPVSF